MPRTLKKHFYDLMSVIPDGGKPNSANADKYIPESDRDKLASIYKILSGVNNANKYNDAYKVIAEVSKSTLDNYNKINNTNRKTFSVVPLMLRKAIYFVIYTRLMIEFGIDRNEKQVKKGNYNKDALDSINAELNNLGMTRPLFNKNSFNSDKWNLHPFEDFKMGVTYTPPEVPFSYNGRKNKILGFMIAELVVQCEYDTFIDLFGGSGAALMSIPFRDGTLEYINDFDAVVVNFYHVMKYKFNEFKKEWNVYVGAILKTNDKELKPQIAIPMHKNCGNSIKNAVVPNGLGDVDLAIKFVFFHYVGERQTKCKGMKNFDADKNKELLKKLALYSKRLKNTEILNRDASDVLRDVNLNTEDTLCYIDSPYTATKGYNVGFDMDSLLSALSGFRGKFIFSCRAAIYQKLGLEELLNDWILYDDEKYEKNVKKAKKIVAKENILAEFFKKFHDKFNGNGYYVLYQTTGRIPIIEEDGSNAEEYEEYINNVIRELIDNNKIFEIMITNFDFKLPDINHYLKGNDFEFDKDYRTKGLCKMEFDEFYDIVYKLLTRTF